MQRLIAQDTTARYRLPPWRLCNMLPASFPICGLRLPAGAQEDRRGMSLSPSRPRKFPGPHPGPTADPDSPGSNSRPQRVERESAASDRSFLAPVSRRPWACRRVGRVPGGDASPRPRPDCIGKSQEVLTCIVVLLCSAARLGDYRGHPPFSQHLLISLP